MTWSTTSSTARGYGAAWRKLREQILRRDSYLCQCDKCQGGKVRVLPAHDVDHIRSKAQGGDDSPENLRAVNRQCHKRITVEQRGDKPKRRISVDGWPIEE